MRPTVQCRQPIEVSSTRVLRVSTGADVDRPHRPHCLLLVLTVHRTVPEPSLSSANKIEHVNNEAKDS